MSVSRSTAVIQTEASQQLLDGLPESLADTFIPRLDNFADPCTGPLAPPAGRNFNFQNFGL